MLNLNSKQMKRLRSIYNALPNASKVAVIVGSLSCIFIVWLLLVFILLPSSSKIQTNIITQKKEIQLLQHELSVLQQKIKTENNPKIIAEEKTQTETLKTINEQIASVRKQMVSPEQLLIGLKKLLGQDTGLTLIALHNLPEEPVSDANVKSLQVFRTPFEMSLQGSFSELLHYFQQIETVHPYIFLDEVTFKTTTHPNAEITLKFHIFTSKAGGSLESKY